MLRLGVHAPVCPHVIGMQTCGCQEVVQLIKLVPVIWKLLPFTHQLHALTSYSFGKYNVQNPISRLTLICDFFLVSSPVSRMWHTACSSSSPGEVVLFGGCATSVLSLEPVII